jgi:hypothetical protein
VTENLLVIVGKERDWDDKAFVVGAFNEEYFNQIDLEDGEKMIADLKKTWTGEPDLFEWREVRVRIPMDEIEKLFQRGDVVGVVEALDN